MKLFQKEKLISVRMFVLILMGVLSGCASDGIYFSQNIQTLRNSYAPRSNKIYAPTLAVRVLSPEDGTDLYQYVKKKMPSFDIIGSSSNNGSPIMQQALEKFSKEIGADAVLSQSKSIGTGTRYGSRTTPNYQQSNILLSDGVGNVVTGTSATIGTETEHFSYEVATYSQKFIFLKKLSDEGDEFNQNRKTFKNLRAPANDPYIGLWESEFWKVEVMLSGSEYIGFFENFYGSDFGRGHTRGDVRFIFNKQNNQGKVFYKTEDGDSVGKGMFHLLNGDLVVQTEGRSEVFVKELKISR